MSAARLWPALALATMLLAACGGGSDDASPVPPGPPVTQSVDASGGKIVLMSSGVKTTLDIPAGALTAATSITVTPVAPVAGESARMSVTPSGLRFAHPVTMTFELPAGHTPTKAAALVLRLNGRPLMLASSVDATARTVIAQIDVLGQFTRSSAASVRVLARAHALAASAPDTEPDGTLSLQDVADIGARVAEAQAEFVNLQIDGEFDKAIVLKLTIAQLLQSSGLDGYVAEAEPWLESARLSACAAFAQASQRASAQVITNLGDYELFGRGVLYWDAIAQALGGNPCPGPSADTVLKAMLAQVAAYMTGKVATPQPAAAFAPLADEINVDVELGKQATTLGVAGVAQHTDSVLVQPVVQPLRDAAFATALQSGDQQAYLPLLAALPDVAELQDDAQYANTTLTLVSRDASGTMLGTVTLGRGATPGSEVTTATLRADVAGSIELWGSVAVLHCPNAATERLQTQFEGVQVDDLASNGDALLGPGQTLVHGMPALLASASIAPASATQAVFVIGRAASSCAPTFGAGNATLATVTLDFAPRPVAEVVRVLSDTTVPQPPPNDGQVDLVNCYDLHYLEVTVDVTTPFAYSTPFVDCAFSATMRLTPAGGNWVVSTDYASASVGGHVSLNFRMTFARASTVTIAMNPGWLTASVGCDNYNDVPYSATAGASYLNDATVAGLGGESTPVPGGGAAATAPCAGTSAARFQESLTFPVAAGQAVLFGATAANYAGSVSGTGTMATISVTAAP
jgi:hypothetical protein